MKILKYILGILLVLTILFFAVGLLFPNVNYQCEVEVNKSKLEAWGVMSDQSKSAQWISGYKKTELISGTAGTIGAVSDIYIDSQGSESVIRETITKLDPPNLIAMDFTNPFMFMNYEMQIKEEGGKTKIKSNTKAKGAGLFSKSLTRLMKPMMVSQEEENLKNLQTLINSNKDTY